MAMKDGMHGGKYGLGHNVGGYCHGGSVKEKVSAKGASTVVTPYPLDTSDYDGGAVEKRPALKNGPSGAAGGYSN